MLDQNIVVSFQVWHKLYYFHFCQNFQKKKTTFLNIKKFENSIKVVGFEFLTSSTKYWSLLFVKSNHIACNDAKYAFMIFEKKKIPLLGQFCDVAKFMYVKSLAPSAIWKIMIHNYFGPWDKMINHHMVKKQTTCTCRWCLKFRFH